MDRLAAEGRQRGHERGTGGGCWTVHSSNRIPTVLGLMQNIQVRRAFILTEGFAITRDTLPLTLFAVALSSYLGFFCLESGSSSLCRLGYASTALFSAASAPAPGSGSRLRLPAPAPLFATAYDPALPRPFSLPVPPRLGSDCCFHYRSPLVVIASALLSTAASAELLLHPLQIVVYRHQQV